MIFANAEIENITETIESEFIQVPWTKRKVLIHKEELLKLEDVKRNRTPCAYSWFEYVPGQACDIHAHWMKDGQAGAGDVITDLRYKIRGTYVITSIIECPQFSKRGQDQKVNQWREDPRNEGGLEIVRDSRVSSLETLKFETLEKWCNNETDKRIALQKFYQDIEVGRETLNLRPNQIEHLIEFLSKPQSLLSVAENGARTGKSVMFVCKVLLKGKTVNFFFAYWQGAHNSVINEIVKYKEFTDVEYAFSNDPCLEQKIDTANEDNKQIVVIVRLHNKLSLIKKQTDFLINKYDNQDKFAFGDEIDFGLHTKGVSEKVKPLIAGVETDFDSGSGIHKIQKNYDVDYFYEPYPYECLLELKNYCKENPDYAKSILMKLKKLAPADMFKDVGIKELDVPDIAFWQRQVENQGETNISWQRIIQDPEKHKGIIIEDTKTYCGANHKLPHMSLDNAIKLENQRRVDLGMPPLNTHQGIELQIEFLPSNTRIQRKDSEEWNSVTMKSDLHNFAEMRRQGLALSGMDRTIKIIEVCGKSQHITTNVKKGYNKGDNVSITTAEDYVGDHIARAQQEGYKKVWVITSIMCQRSFTQDLQIVLLSFDGGEAGSVGQRVLRLGSPGPNKNCGIVVSNSFGGRREDYKVIDMIEKMVSRRTKRTGESRELATRKILLSTSVFGIDNNGDQMRYDYDEHCRALMLNHPTKVIAFSMGVAKQSHKNLPSDIIQNILNLRAKGKIKVKALPKTFKNKNRKKSKHPNNKSLTIDELKKISEFIKSTLDNLHVFNHEHAGIERLCENIIGDEKLSQDFEYNIGLPADQVKQILCHDAETEAEVDKILKTREDIVNDNILKSFKRVKEMVNHG
jgi:hypothetical protein